MATSTCFLAMHGLAMARSNNKRKYLRNGMWNPQIDMTFYQVWSDSKNFQHWYWFNNFLTNISNDQILIWRETWIHHMLGQCGHKLFPVKQGPGFLSTKKEAALVNWLEKDEKHNKDLFPSNICLHILHWLALMGIWTLPQTPLSSFLCRSENWIKVTKLMKLILIWF